LIPGARAVLARGWRRALRSSDAPGPRRLAWPLSRSASGSAPGARQRRAACSSQWSV